ncbi:MAG: FTR1 family iron permease [Propionibacteriaceae bacterium]|nr:FTR1 family iron permease [Propionibacteriaceae bacterium]
MTRKFALAAILAVAALFCLAEPAWADGSTWADEGNEVKLVLEEGWQAFQGGDIAVGRAKVDEAYYSHYDLSFEATVKTFISGQAATDAEYEFKSVKKAMSAGDDGAVRAHLDKLEALIDQQSQILDGTRQGAGSILVEALVIILREGFEAILVLGAIIAYLVKAGRQDKLWNVYAGALLALAASVALAFAINAVTALSGANQEVLEGATALIAVVMLVWVSNWILGKSDAGAWAHYIKAKTAASLSGGSVLPLVFAAFLAVFREGAETILLLQAVKTRAGADSHMVWIGLGIGALALAAVYLAIRRLSIKLPLRPFFLATSVILAILAVSFAGSGVSELQEADVISNTRLPWPPTVDLLGIYPSAQTLAAQGLTLAAMALLSLFALRRARRRASRPTASTAAEAAQSSSAAEASNSLTTSGPS